MTDEERFIALAKRLIDKRGNSVTLNKTTRTYDPSQGKVVSIVNESIPLRMWYEKYESKEIEGLIQVGDVKGLVYAQEGVEYTDKDTIVAKGINYNIINGQPLETNDQVIIIELHLRR